MSLASVLDHDLPVWSSEPQVGDDEVWTLHVDPRHRVKRVRGCEALVALEREEPDTGSEEIRLVVDDQDSHGFTSTGAAPCSLSTREGLAATYATAATGLGRAFGKPALARAGS